MQCPHCGYFMSPLDKECLRCRQNGYVAPPSVVPTIGPNAVYAPPPQPNYAQPAPAPVAPLPLPFDLPEVGMPAPVAQPSAQPLDLSQGYAVLRPATPTYAPPQPAPMPPTYGAPPAAPVGPGYRAPNSGPYMPSAPAASSSQSSSQSSRWNTGQVFGGTFGSIGVILLVCLRIWNIYDREERRRINQQEANAHYNATIGRQINNSAAMVEQSRQNAANFTPPPRYTVPQNMSSTNNMSSGTMSGQNSAFQQMQESQQRMQQMQQANQQRMQQMQQESQQRMQDMQQRMQQHRPGF